MVRFIREMRQIVGRLTADLDSAPWVSLSRAYYFGFGDGFSETVQGIDDDFYPGLDADLSDWRSVLVLECIFIESGEKANAVYRKARHRLDAGSERAGLLARARSGDEAARDRIRAHPVIPEEIRSWATGQVDFVDSGPPADAVASLELAT